MGNDPTCTHSNRKLGCLLHCGLYQRTIEVTCPVCRKVVKFNALPLWWHLNKRGIADALADVMRRRSDGQYRVDVKFAFETNTRHSHVAADISFQTERGAKRPSSGVCETKDQIRPYGGEHASEFVTRTIDHLSTPRQTAIPPNELKKRFRTVPKQMRLDASPRQCS